MVVPFRIPGALLKSPVNLVNGDAWDGYGADQKSLLAHLAAQPAEAGDTVVLTGDIHSSWAADIPSDQFASTTYESVGVEFVTPSVTSDGFYELSATVVPPGTPPEARVALVGQVVGQIQALNPWTKYLDGIGHGFLVVDVTPERVQADYFHTATPSSAMPEPRAPAPRHADVQAEHADARGQPRRHAGAWRGSGGVRTGPADRADTEQHPRHDSIVALGFPG